jgi:hypothetical protein
MYMRDLDQQKAEGTVNFLKEESHKLYLAARNIVLFVPGLVAIITAGTLDEVPSETSFGPHINEYPNHKSPEPHTWLENVQQVGVFIAAILSHPKELNSAVKDYLKPEE